MSETENEIKPLNIGNLIKKDLKDFNKEIDIISTEDVAKETLQYILNILLEGKKNPKIFSTTYGPNIRINQRAIKVAVVLKNVKSGSNSILSKKRS